MARQPLQAHIFLYRKAKNGFEYAIFRRSDHSECWQGICGGMEDDETVEQGAIRELFEESGVVPASPLHRLETVSYIPTWIFSKEERQVWGEDVFVFPMYYFALEYDGEIRLSEEHTEYRWLDYPSAKRLLYFDDQRTALYELDGKLTLGIIK
ncbi:MAG: NUDIX domain-containing protein [Clostridia bacterium]|nr:NUDIX domain-containing protein [Clostridia bacterium]